ncbi:PD40 domain-containing protein [Pseudoalteromonas aurantia]|uniref:WD40-like Beta Propeller Repeat n=1 Tax=Pseudoalteromonas aurantia TaxID=43654 RepID=A0A5S3VDS8_9GAMM|nr:PD40 domain-containing protein [Pseudoalteromonas aurantia]TMO69801.1 hypothetical protein CWC19_03400 [Pseudoalteromonas aurantia]
MKRIGISTVLFFSAIALSGNSDSQAQPIGSEARYFGEKPPGLTPKVFEPKVVSPEGLFESGTFTPDLKTFYFTRANGKYKQRTFFVIRYDGKRWGPVSETPIRWPQFSHDGNTMYVAKKYRERVGDRWSELKTPGDFLKENAHGLSVSLNGTYYFPFFKKEDNGHGNLGYSRLIDGKYENPVKLGPEINQGDYIAHPYIAPDESYLIWDVLREDGNGQSDLYISFKDTDGTWRAAQNMGPLINTNLQESSPIVSHDGKYLFFIRGNWHYRKDGSRYYVGKQHWVDAKVIAALRPK